MSMACRLNIAELDLSVSEIFNLQVQLQLCTPQLDHARIVRNCSPISTFRYIRGLKPGMSGVIVFPAHT